MSTLASVAPWFGSKRLLAPAIVSHFAKNDTFYDLFCGSCSILFEKEPSRQEVASEKNPDLVNLLRCLADQNDAEFLHREASHRLLSESLFRDAALRLAEPWEFEFQNLSRAIEFLTVSWQGPSGLAGTTAKPRFAKRNTASGGSTAARWRSVAESIPAWHERLRNVEFRNADAFEILQDVPDREGCVVYSDYVYHPDSRRGGTYVFDALDENGKPDPKKHELLAEKLGRFKKTQVVVSYGECEAINKLYAGWRKVRLDAPRKMQHTRGGHHPHEDAGECLFINQ